MMAVGKKPFDVGHIQMAKVRVKSLLLYNPLLLGIQ